MAKPRASYPENRKEVYKFWLGFFEKLNIVLVTVVIIPRVLGQLNYSLQALTWAIILFLVLLAIKIYLGRRVWYLPKDDQKTKGEEK